MTALTASGAGCSGPGRALSLFERYTVSKANIRSPSTVAFLATFPHSASAHISPDRVKQAIAHLLRRYALLRCAVAGGRTRSPSYALARDVDPSVVLELVSAEAGSEVDRLNRQINSGLTFNGSKGPLWRVSVYEGAEDGVRPAVGLTISHALTDGTGSRNLFQQLLALLHPNSAVDLNDLPELKEQIPPSFEDTIGVKLTLLGVLKLVRNEIIKPKLRPLLPSKAHFVPPSPKFEFQPIQTALFRLPANEVDELKKVAKSHNIATLHPLIHGAILAAIYLAAPPKTATTEKPGTVKVLTPITLRDMKGKGHPFATGNYISALTTSHALDPSSAIFDLSRKYAVKLASPRKRREAIELMLALGLVSDPKPKLSSALEQGKQYPLTGMDAYLLAYRDGHETPDGDLSVSNLQVLLPTGWEKEEGFELSWGQTVGPYEAPMTVNLISLKGGPMMVSVNWIGGAVEDGAYAKRFMRELERVLGRLARGQVEERTTIESLRS